MNQRMYVWVLLEMTDKQYGKDCTEQQQQKELASPILNPVNKAGLLYDPVKDQSTPTYAK